MKRQETIREFIVITFITVTVAIAVSFFLMSNHVSMGSISDPTIILRNSVPLKTLAITSTLDTLLLVPGFLFIGREFGAKIVYTSFLLPVVLAVFETTFLENTSITNDAFLDIVCYIFAVSTRLAMLFNRNTSPGDLDIVAKLLDEYLRMELDQVVSMLGMRATLSAALIYDKKTVVPSILGTHLSRIILDYPILGFNIKKRVCIISQREEEIREFVLHYLHNGAMIYEAIRAYNGQLRRKIITIVDRNEYVTLINCVLRTNGDTLITVYTVSETIYRPEY